MSEPDRPSALLQEAALQLEPGEVPRKGALARLRSFVPALRATGPQQSEVVSVEPDAPRHGLFPLRRVSYYWASLVLCFLLPACAATLYFFWIASDQFVAEARFAVRNAQIDRGRDVLSSNAGAGGASVARTELTGLPALAGQDAQVIAAYVRSPAILDELATSLDIPAIYRRPEADFWARLPRDAGRETLLDYWRSMVGAFVDVTSGIVTVTVKAFRPDDAKAIADKIVAASEKLANELSARARADAMTRAEDEVRRSEKQIREVLARLQTLRETDKIISPVAEATSTSTLLMQAIGERVRLQAARAAAMRTLSASAPSVTGLTAQVDAIDAEIAKLKSQLTTTDAAKKDGTVAASLARFEELEIKRQFAEKLYGIAQDGLERARQRVERQNVYVSTFVTPMAPQEALFPERVASSVLIAIILLMLWGIQALLVAAVRDHME